ncbi:MAG: hypothetical protein RH949_16335 [Coleofasciculus sp. A1-SPW-01]|uniref:hypothetical protein n=1 Tax=Coleofasciculus sp. A1-SPW-01 TaxID=3070819 RepID=UPI00330132F2
MPNLIAHCLLPIAYCPLPIAHCLLPIAHCPLPIAHCLARSAIWQDGNYWAVLSSFLLFEFTLADEPEKFRAV